MTRLSYVLSNRVLVELPGPPFDEVIMRVYPSPLAQEAIPVPLADLELVLAAYSRAWQFRSEVPR